MNKKNITFIAVLCAVTLVLALAFALFERGRWQGTSPERQNVIDELEVNAVAALVIRGAGDERVTLRRGDERWTVAERFGYPADFNLIRELVIRISELKVSQRLEVSPARLAQLQLVSPDAEAAGSGQGIRLELLDAKDHRLAALVIGREHFQRPAEDRPEMMFMPGQPIGRYLRHADDKENVFLVGDRLDAAKPSPLEWLDKHFLAIRDVRAISRGGENGWRISRESRGGPLKMDGIAEGEELDAAKASSLAGAFGFFSFDDVMPGETPAAEVGFDQPLEIAVDTFDGFTYLLTIGERDGHAHLRVTVELSHQEAASEPADGEPADAEPADAADGGAEEMRERLERESRLASWIYQIPKQKFDSLNKSRDDLLKQPESAGDEAS